MRILILNKSGQVWWIVHGPGFWTYDYYNKYISERDHLSTKPFSCSYNCEGLLPTELHNIRPTPLLWFLSPYTHKRALSSLWGWILWWWVVLRLLFVLRRRTDISSKLYTQLGTHTFSHLLTKKEAQLSLLPVMNFRTRGMGPNLWVIYHTLELYWIHYLTYSGTISSFYAPAEREKIWCRGIWRWI